VANADALVLTADTPPGELSRWFNEACLAARVPFITAGQWPPLIRVGPLYVPGTTACFACHETALRTQSLAYDSYVDHARDTPPRAATLGPASAIVGAVIAQELVHLLIGVEPATLATAHSIDIRTLQVVSDVIPRDAGCDACGTTPTSVDRFRRP
jgi:bacteriocin biosynthesis cyclodehydratase domain-containing protein